MSEIDRRAVTFRQAQGLEPLPQPLQLEDLSREARILLWEKFDLLLPFGSYADESSGYDTVIGTEWNSVMRRWHVRKLLLPSDEYDRRLKTVSAYSKFLILNRPYDEVFDYLTFIMRDENMKVMEPHFASSFAEARMAYTIEDATIFPAATPEEGTSVRHAFEVLTASEFGGARSHLRLAGELISSGDWAGGVRESIHAVESVAKVIDPSAKTLSDALKKLANANAMNPNLKRGLEALYNYSSDEKGIRHAMVFNAQPNVDRADAVYMFGACAAFVSFLIARSKTIT
ncbi:hypothetical protein IFT67_14390 [Sphingomonas sp. CFBP 13728]|uniref:AbiJ-NTD4 domain-containing protein n=1 Tax=Sphingomonas sp. CFBP 13728 TaxID=2775294 RepID=UPI00177C9D63|nr:hypothetical protein [Sphingomonas sp. CFBP 13728]MBD8620115.1 hypothetical protein [Sphingomonas sp. CFBP 13728]